MKHGSYDYYNCMISGNKVLDFNCCKAHKVNTMKYKYHNTKVTIDGFNFQSKAEANYYCELKLRQKAKDIDYFLMQVPFHLNEGGEKITYRVDFMVIYPDKTIEYIDVKGVETAKFKIKKKLVENQYNVNIKIIKYNHRKKRFEEK
jgi:hypothetical protein